MLIDDDSYGPAFSALTQPYNDGLQQPVMPPTTLFGGDIPAVHLSPVKPMEPAKVTPLHGPLFKPIYENAPVHAQTRFAEVHAIVGHVLDRVG